MLEIRLLGQFTVEAEGQPVEMPSRTAQSLLAYLALNAGTPQRREKLAGMFWPEATETNARSNLRHALWRIRKAIGPSPQTGRDYLNAHDLTITFETNGDCWLDTAILQQKSSESGSIDTLIETVSVYRGDLLPGFYDEWVVLERERLQAIFERKMQTLLERLLEVRRWSEALEWAEHWIAFGHTPEPAYRVLMVAHSGLGDRSSLVAVYQRCVEALRQELGVEPSEQTHELYERLFRGDTPPFATPPGLSGQAIGPYRVVEKLGAGSMAEVYKAYQPRLDRYIALKFIRPDLTDAEGFRSRFEREAKLLAKLNHPHIVHIYDFGEQGDRCYLAMEYVAGGTLKEWLRSLRLAGQVMTPEQALIILQQISAALNYAHQQGIIHRDIKPANIMLTPDGRALLSDFGIAKLMSAAGDIAQTGATTGTPAYMSPEQISGGAAKVGPPSDVYSLGVVLYELLTGQTPFLTDTPVAMMLKQVQEVPPPPASLNPALSPAVDEVLLKALAKEPAVRYQRAGELIQAFQAALAAPSINLETEATLLRGSWWPQGPNETPTPGDPPFKGLQYFDEADADLFFGRELLTARLVARLNPTPSLALPLQEGGDFSPSPTTGESRGGEPFLAVVGASGSGKSSLARAGLIPAFKRGQPLADGSLPPEGSASWPIHVITPTAHPLESLAASLTCDSESVTATATLMDDLAHDSRSLHLYVRRLLNQKAGEQGRKGVGEILSSPLSASSPPRFLLVVDQFEELFTLCRDEAERRAFVDNLLIAAGLAGPKDEGGGMKDEDNSSTFQPVTIVVITLRADFYAHCAQFELLRQALAKYQEYIGPMNAAELRRAIEEPAQQGGWTFEPGLVDFLLEEVGAEPGALPLLSHALLETWQRRRGRTLTFGGYRESGGIRGAIAKTADRVWSQFGPEQQTIARNILLRLTELGEGTQDTRRRVARSELEALPTADQRPPTAEESNGQQSMAGGLPPALSLSNGSAVASVLHTLADARLITTDEDSIEVAHEALIREWPLLRQWLDENREGLRLHRRLTEAAQEWATLNRDSGALYRGARLAAAGEWAETHANELNPLEREFLEASRTQQVSELETAQKQARQLRRRALYLSGAFAVAMVMAVIALVLAGQARQSTRAAQIQQATAEAERDRAKIAFSNQLAAQAMAQMTDQLDLALLLSLEAYRTANTSEARASLQTVLEASPHLTTFLRGHTDWVRQVAFSPDGQTLASASADNSIILWDVTTGQPLGPPLAGHTATVFSLAFSPDGQTLASGGGDGIIILWDVTTRQPLDPPLTGHTAAVWSVAFSPNGHTLASSSADSTIILWDVAAHEPLGPPLIGHTDGVTDLAFSPDGRTLVSSSADKTLMLWNVAQRQPLDQPLKGHTAEVWGVAFSPDGQTLASGSDDKTIILWDVTQRQSLSQRLSGHSEGVASVAFSPAPPDGSVQPPSGTGGQMLASGSGDCRSDCGGSDDPSPGGYPVTLWNVLTRQPVSASLTGHTAWVGSVTFSPDGQTLASGSDDKTIILWDVTTHKPLGPPLIGHPSYVSGLAFSPDGQTLTSSSEDGTIILWDMATRQPLGPPLVSPKNQRVLDLAFSPNGQILASGDGDTVILWDVAARQPLGPPLAGHTDVVWSVAFSPDGQILASGSADTTIILWDVATRQPLGPPLAGHTGPVRRVTFSPDGQVLATGSWGNTIILWDMPTRRPLGLPLTVPFDAIYSLAFSPDGHTLASSGKGSAIILWDVSIESWQARACRMANRNLTQEEWTQYFGEEEPYRETCVQSETVKVVETAEVVKEVEKVATQEVPVEKGVDIQGPIPYPTEVPLNLTGVAVKKLPVDQIVIYKALPAYHEPEWITALVKKGELPPVEERLPKEPQIVLTSGMADGIGEYGDVWRDWSGCPTQGWNHGAGITAGWFGIEAFSISQGSLVKTGPLYRVNQDLEPLPNLAKSWEWSDDGKVLTMRLIEGAKWSDGEPFTSEDVIFTWEDYINDPNVNSWKKASDWEVEGKPTQLEALDDYTIKFTFPAAKPVEKFYLMDEQDFDVMPAHLLKVLHPKYNQEMDYKEFENALPPNAVPIPTMGPWVPVEYKTDELLVMRRNPYYWKVDEAGKQLPYIDEVVFQKGQTGAGRGLCTVGGDCDHANLENPLAEFEIFKRAQTPDAHFDLHWGPEVWGLHVQINQSADLGVKDERDAAMRQLFRDLRFRRALSHATDRDGIIQAMTQEPFLRAWAGGLLPGSPQFERESVVYYPYAPEAAKALLTDLGFEDTDGNSILNWTSGPLKGQDLTVALTANEDLPDSVNLAEALANNWGEVGIQVNFRPVAYAARQEIEQSGEWEMHVSLSLFESALPFTSCSDLAPIGKNAPIWHKEGDQPRQLQPFEEELVKLVEQYCPEQDPAKRKALINQYNHIFTENVYSLGVFVVRQSLALAKRFQNVPSGIPVFLYNWVEYSMMPEQIWTPKDQQIEQLRPNTIPIYTKKY